MIEQVSPIRVATWNLWWRFGPWQQRRDAIAAVLAETRPDICGLQEVWATSTENLAARLADELDMYWIWAASPAPERWQRRIDDPTIQIGNAILSRWPISDEASQPLPAGSGKEECRTVLFGRVQSPAGAVPFFTTQLCSAIGQSAVRCRQVATVSRFVAAHASSAFPPVVTGDFNAEPDADEMRLLGGYKTTPGGARSGTDRRLALCRSPDLRLDVGSTQSLRRGDAGTGREDRLHPGRDADRNRRRPCPVGPAHRTRARAWRLAVRPCRSPRRTVCRRRNLASRDTRGELTIRRSRKPLSSRRASRPGREPKEGRCRLSR